jgi:tetratricopeptide (TPR) repeat protein
MKLNSIIITILIFSNFAVAQDQQKLEAAFSQSYSFESEKSYADAIESILKVYTDNSYETNIRLGWLYYQYKKYPESTNYYKRATLLKPNSIEAKLGLAGPIAAQSSWDAVIDVYNDILKIDANQVSVNYKLGLIFYNRQDFILAKKYFDTYLGLYPFDYDALSISAWNNLKLGKKDLAKELFNKALLLYPKNTDSLEGIKQCK